MSNNRRNSQNLTRNTDAALEIRRGARLPHWTRDGSTYFVTFRLGDSVPRQIAQRWRSERDDIVKTAQQLGRDLSAGEKERLRLLRSERIERYLDAGHGACRLRDERIAAIVADALQHFDGERYDLTAWCVMPNHVHVLVRPRSGYHLHGIVHSWKSFTARRANQILSRKGTFWRSEYYDHLVRDKADCDRILEYILKNPEKAGLKRWKWLSG